MPQQPVVGARTPAGPGVSGPPAREGRLRRMLRTISAPRDELEAEEARSASAHTGATPLTECHERDCVCVSGTLRSVRLEPRAGEQTLTAELYDGTGSITLVFLGRRRIPGIEAGRTLLARGRVTGVNGSRAIFNPDYELLPADLGRR